MPRKAVWSEGQDTQIKRLRTEGASWDAIAQVLGFTRWTVIERARRLGVSKRPVHVAPPPPDLDRPPLPAGHPDSWGAITQNTCLDQVPFRIPSEIR